jgi:hypothetical protein
MGDLRSGVLLGYMERGDIVSSSVVTTKSMFVVEFSVDGLELILVILACSICLVFGRHSLVFHIGCPERTSPN